VNGPRFLGFGALFGFALSRARVTDYDTIAGMFRLTDLHLVGVIGSAIATAAVGFWLLRRSGNRTLTGWALSGACPGTALAQVGEGKLAALFTVGGILGGTYLYGRVRSRLGTPAAPARAAAAAS